MKKRKKNNPNDPIGMVYILLCTIFLIVGFGLGFSDNPKIIDYIGKAIFLLGIIFLCIILFKLYDYLKSLAEKKDDKKDDKPDGEN